MVTENTSKASQRYENHPLANIFPMMEEADLKALADDIKANGVREPGTLFQGKILDGRNRYAATLIAGVEMDFCDCSLSDQEDQDRFDPLAFVLSHNLHRRHLTTAQRSLVAAKIANLKHGDVATQKSEGQNCTSINEAAKQLNVSPRSVKSAKQVIKSADAKVIAAVEQGAMTVNKAVTLVLKKPAKKSKPTKDSSPPVAKKPDEPPLSETWQLAQMAIDKLELIDISDQDRRAAFWKVSVWINCQLNAERGTK